MPDPTKLARRAAEYQYRRQNHGVPADPRSRLFQLLVDNWADCPAKTHAYLAAEEECERLAIKAQAMFSFLLELAGTGEVVTDEDLANHLADAEIEVRAAIDSGTIRIDDLKRKWTP